MAQNEKKCGEDVTLKERIINQSTLIEQGVPSVYQIPLQELFSNESDRIRKYEFGQKYENGTTEKVILVVGATGSGKTTAVNALLNFVLGVEWQDNVRFKLIAETTSGDQSKSQTTWITSYIIHQQDGFKVSYTLNIVDTPGYGDTGGIERDKKITDQIHKFFSTKGSEGIDHIDAVVFVAQSSNPRLTPTQKYIFDSILALFGKDIGENIVMFLTYADSQKPPILDSLKTFEMPYKTYFKINNAVLYAQKCEQDQDDDFDEVFWNMCNKNLSKFLCDHISQAKPKTLVLTNEVLEERHRLEVHVQGIHFDIQRGLNTLEQLQTEIQVLKKHKAALDANKDFKYKVTEEKIKLKPIPPGTYTTNCQKCKRTCHFPCGIKDNENKINCWAMTDGVCRICPNHCVWNIHFNLPHTYVIKRKEVTKTSKDLKEKYKDAYGKTLNASEIIKKVLEEFNNRQKNVVDLIDKIRKCIERLNEIALKPNPMSVKEYVEILIETEKAEARPGFLQRIKQLTNVLKQAEFIQKLACEGVQPFEKYEAVIAECGREDLVADIEEITLLEKDDEEGNEDEEKESSSGSEDEDLEQMMNIPQIQTHSNFTYTGQVQNNPNTMYNGQAPRSEESSNCSLM